MLHTYVCTYANKIVGFSHKVMFDIIFSNLRFRVVQTWIDRFSENFDTHHLVWRML